MSEISCGTIPIFHANFKTLPEHTSHLKLFKIKLSSYYKLVPELTSYLNAIELHRARKYHFEKDRNQFVICRTLLKFILAQHTNSPISEINIDIDSNNKPFLSSNKSICFNVSHASDYGIIIVRNDDAVGIDIEYLNNDFNFSEIMPDIYSAIEIDTVLNARNKAQAFYKFWTRKEAIVKATGTGISDFLPQIPAVDGRHTIDSKFLDGYNSLQVLSFDLEENYTASLALSGENLNFDKFLVYNLPNSIEELLSFSRLNSL